MEMRTNADCCLVQSLNSPFFPPPIGAEPGRAKRESRITCVRMLRTPPFFPPKSREKTYLEVFTADGKRQRLLYKTYTTGQFLRIKTVFHRQDTFHAYKTPFTLSRLFFFFFLLQEFKDQPCGGYKTYKITWHSVQFSTITSDYLFSSCNP